MRLVSSPRFWALALGLGLLSGCGGSDGADEQLTVSSLRLIGQQVLPRRLDFQGTVVGGLSGVDYDAGRDEFILVSDDRTPTDSVNPPRMYTARLNFDLAGFYGVELRSTFTLRQPDGTVYPKVPDPAVADPEAVRLDRRSGLLVWASEGDRTLASGGNPERLVQPFVREIRRDGHHVREYTLPSMFRITNGAVGPRGNAVFEGLAFTPSGHKLAVMMEGTRFEDGTAPSPSAGASARLTIFDRNSGTALRQHAVPLDKVQAEPVPAGSFSVNGATEILALSETRFLMLERSFSVGVLGNQVRLYEIDTAAASDVLGLAALGAGEPTPVSKRLVLNFETLKTALGGIANLEGLSFGPKLANGHASLIVVADDNFPTADSVTDRNQILVFEVLP